MKANGLERIFRQGPAVKLCIFIGPTDEYSDFFEPILPYYMAICEDNDVMPVVCSLRRGSAFALDSWAVSFPDFDLLCL
jgi:hypothetical protein